MNEIKCPKCGEVFQIDEASYASILKQVRDEEFNKEIESRLDNAVKLAKNETEIGFKDDLADKDAEITKLKAKIEAFENEKTLAVKEAVSEKDIKIQKLENELENAGTKAELEHNNIVKDYEIQMKAKDEEIAFYKDLKAKQSTKMIGETLEQHCEISFNQIRATGFKNAYFEKDNDAKSGSKGDYIYRDFDENGEEFISIMFEMKNEMDTTEKKHKNEDFFKELDKDRNEKKCEYAILVSMLESDSELYNQGIVDVSHKYPKMYVIRPQFFIPIITMLRNAALNSLEYRTELAEIKNQNIDIAHFEENIETFKSGFSRNYNLASQQFAEAIKNIDKSIDDLNKIKKDLLRSENNLRLANDKANKLSIKSLTQNSPTMAKKFEELKEQKELEESND